jgi:predicted PurR-regulated permease PerM
MQKYREFAPLALFLILAVVSFLIIKPFLGSIFIGGILAYIFYFAYRWLSQKMPGKTLPALLICIFVLLLILIPGVYFIKALVQESYSLYVIAKQRLSIGIFNNCDNGICSTIRNYIQDPKIAFQIQEGVTLVTNLVVKKGSNFLLSLPRIILNFFVIFFTMFYFLKDGPRLIRLSNKIFGMDEHRHTFIVRRLRQVLHGTIHGYLIVAIIQGILGGLGFWLFGVPSPIFWGFIMSFLAIIPFLGTGLIWAPASLFMILDGVFQDSTSTIIKGVGLLAYGLIIVSSSDNILRPKLMGDKAKVHPGIILLGTLGGVFFFGIIGVIAGPLILSFTSILIDSYLFRS